MHVDQVATQAQIAPPTPAPSTSPAAPGELDRDAFLRLLVAQLRYQDPMAPSDPGALLAQSSQMAVVERLEELATSTDALLTAERARGATALLGRNVTWTDPATAAERTGVVSSVRLGPTGPTLVVGDVEISPSDVVSVA